MLTIETVIDEIALEGSEGITLECLFQRLLPHNNNQVWFLANCGTWEYDTCRTVTSAIYRGGPLMIFVMGTKYECNPFKNGDYI